MANISELKAKLRKYKKEDIIITTHAEIQALARDIDIGEVKDNIVKPDKLVYAEKQETNKVGEKK